MVASFAVGIALASIPANSSEPAGVADSPAPPSAPGVESPFRPPQDRRSDPTGPKLWVYVAVIVVVIAVVVGTVYFATGGFHRGTNGTSEVILVANQTQWSIPVTQFNGVNFEAATNATVNATLYESGGLQIYTMTPAQEAAYLKTFVIQGYEWTSGVLANNSVYRLGVSVNAGSWDLVFMDPFSNITYAPTLVAFYTDMVLTPS